MRTIFVVIISSIMVLLFAVFFIIAIGGIDRILFDDRGLLFEYVYIKEPQGDAEVEILCQSKVILDAVYVK